MVRGNWQKRVETAEARRKEAKQRKQKTDDKRQYKNWMQELLRNLDEGTDRLRHSGKATVRHIHVWTDTLPSDSPPLLDLFVDHSGGGVGEGSVGGSPSKSARRGKNRSNSLDIIESGRKGRGRSNSTADKAKKKLHPRSKESLDDADGGLGEANDSTPLLLCRSQFFTGKCEEATRKRGACSCLHFSNHSKTLSQVMQPKKRPANRQHLLAAEAAAEMALEDSVNADVGAMEMAYYVSVGLSGRQEEPEPSFSEYFVGALSQKKVVLASIVYVAIGDVLVYDRYREGVLLPSNEDFISALAVDDTINLRKLSIGSEGDGEDEANFHLLPGTVLELILYFLPDASVAAASQVCKSWHREIGQNSPNLWRHLLDRRYWPLPREESSEAEEGEQKRYRHAFLSHYSVIRDSNAIQQSWNALEHSRWNIIPREMAYQDFSRRKNAPSDTNECVGVDTWGPNQVLAAYEQDCSLRLFETYIKPESSERGCKELVCQRVDPYRNTRKRHCRMLSMGVDDQCIASLCLVSTDSVTAVAHVLVVVNRDEFLLGESSDVVEKPNASGAHLNVFDMGEAVLNYIISESAGTDSLHEVLEFLQDGGEIGSVEVLVSNQFAACGYGRFMLEVAVSAPRSQDNEDADEIRLVDRKLVLFSAGVGSIVWMGGSVSLLNGPVPRSEAVNVSSIRRPVGSTRATCSMAVSPEKSPGSILLLEVDSAGHVADVNTIDCPTATVSQLQEDNCSPAEQFRALQITPTHVVVADSFNIIPPPLNDDNEDAPVDPPIPRCKVVTSLVPRGAPAADISSSSAVVHLCGRTLKVLQLSCIRDDYLVLVTIGHHPQDDHNDNDPILDDLAGQWFQQQDNNTTADDAGDDAVVQAWAILLHIPTGREIGRRLWLADAAHLLNDNGNDDSASNKFILSADAQGTIGLGLSGRGIAMTGSDVRAVGGVSNVHIIPDTQNVRSGKKKKKRKANIAGKKDGFARGMSLRG